MTARHPPCAIKKAFCGFTVGAYARDAAIEIKDLAKKVIVSWEKVTAVDPDDKDVQQNLKKAILLNDRLERIRKSKSH
jgi:hypothetical protein